MGTGIAFAATTANAANPDNDILGRTVQGAETRVTFENEEGQEVEISNPQFMRPAGRFRIEEDGSRTPVQDDWVDSFYERHNIPQSPSIFEREDADVVEFSFSIYAKDGSALAGEPGIFDIIPPLPTYTDEEWAQIIADIESGKLQPSGQVNADGTITIWNRPDNPFRNRDGAELTEIILQFGDTTESFSDDRIIWSD
jgi:hypothetical protein